MAEQRQSGRVGRRRGAAVVALVVVAALLSPAGVVSAQSEPPIVTITAVAANEFQGYGCDDAPPTIERTPGSVTVTRTGDTTESLEVDVVWTGDLVGDPGLPALPDPLVIPAGSSATTLELPASEPYVALEVTIEPSGAYALGTPSTARFETTLSVSAPICIELPDERLPKERPVEEQEPLAPDPAAPIRAAATFTG